MADNSLSMVYEATVWRDLIQPISATSLFRYSDRHYDMYSAVTVNQFGEGNAYYIGCGLEPVAISRLVKKVLDRHAIFHEESPSGVEIVYRGGSHNSVKMIMNHNDHQVTMDSETIAPYGVLIKKVDIHEL